MMRPGAAVAPRPALSDVGGVAAGLALAVLAVLLVWPLAALLATGLTAPLPSAALVVASILVALASTLGALALGGLLAMAVRAGMPGRHAVVAVCRLGVLLPPFLVPLALLGLVTPRGRGAIVLAQAFVFLPHAFALLSRALGVVSAEAEQAAELLGASRWTVLRRVTLGRSAPGLGRAALVVLGLCLADVATPLLVGGESAVLAGAVVAAATRGHAGAASAAVVLSLLTLGVALAGRTWRHAAVPLALPAAAPPGRRVGTPARRLLGLLAWGIVGALLALWTLVPLASLGLARAGAWRWTACHWADIVAAGAWPLLSSAALGVGVAVVGAVLSLAAAWTVARRRGPAADALAVLARLPVAIPGVAAGLGYLLAFGMPRGELALLALLVAAWELPLTLRAAANVLARADRATEQAAATLGAGRLTTVVRIVLPALRDATAWIACHGLAAGVAAVGPVVVLVGLGLELGVIDMLASASAGSVGAACAVATVLLAIAGGAALLGRAVAGRQSVPTLLA